MAFLDDHDEGEDGYDITNFVRLLDHTSYSALVKAVLEEIPGQVVDHYGRLGIDPTKELKVTKSQLEPLDADSEEKLKSIFF